ncbi:MAG: ComF family protein [Dissulfurimicrobium sp.]
MLTKIALAALNILDEIFFPCLCAACGARLENAYQGGLCADCLSKIKKIEHPLCTICGMPFVSLSGEDHICGACLKNPPIFKAARAIFEYDGPIRILIKKIKFHDDRYALKTICNLTKRYLEAWPSGLSNPTLLIPVPLHISRLRERGFNQALDLAKGIFPDLPIHTGLISRNKKTLSQTGLDAQKRIKNVRDAFCARNTADPSPEAVTIIDDIFTTGSTVNACALALKKAGTKHIDVFTVARTVKKHSTF